MKIKNTREFSYTICKFVGKSKTTKNFHTKDSYILLLKSINICLFCRCRPQLSTQTLGGMPATMVWVQHQDILQASLATRSHNQLNQEGLPRRNEEKKVAEDDGNVTKLSTKKHSRHFVWGEDLDQKVQIYLKKVREGGRVVSARIAVNAAKRILFASERSRLVEFKGRIGWPDTGHSHF